MNSVVSFPGFTRPKSRASLFVLVDLQQGRLQPRPAETGFSNALTNCSIALANARDAGIPIAFTRQISAPASFGARAGLPPWIAGFEPRRSDMVFDREHPSCYANPEFLHIVNRIGGNCVIAGLSGDSSCLATILDGYHRGHCFTYMADASISNPCQQLSAATVHDVVIGIISQYAVITSTHAWIRRISHFMASQ